jgi:energy-coupling factor transporter ATP-binding protein EcfA2
VKIIIENFQAIAQASLEATGFTVIVGDSNVGKSSIIRFITGLLANKLEVASIKQGAATSVGSLEYGGHLYEVVRDKKTVTYRVDGVVFSKLNRRAHPLIGEHGLRVVKVADVELTPQWVDDQFSPLMLLSKSTPSTVAAGLVTQASRLDVIATAQKNGAAELRSSKIELGTRQADQESFKTRLARYEGVESLREAVLILGTQLKRLKQDEQKKQGMILWKEQWRFLIEEEKTLQPLDQVLVPEAPDSGKVNSLKDVKDWFRTWKRLDSQAKVLLKVGEILIPEGLESQQVTDVTELRRINQQWKDFKQQEALTQQELKVVCSAQEELIRHEKDVRRELKICPICGGKL